MSSFKIGKMHRGKKCIIYWDYENCPIPSQSSSFGNVHDVIKRRIFAYLQYEVPIETKIYIAAHKIPNKISQEMDISGAKNIDIPSLKPEAVDKRILVDLALDLYEWSKHGTTYNIVCLVSGDKDFGNILGRIHNCREIVKLILIRLPREDGKELPVNKNLYSCVDYVIDANHGTGFVVEEFIDCKHGRKCNRREGNCRFYHHQTHYIKKQNSYLKSPHLDNDDFKMDKRLKAIRSKMPCKWGDTCKKWKNDRCHYFHATKYMGKYHKPCRNGNQCKDFQKGVCRYIHEDQSQINATANQQEIMMKYRQLEQQMQQIQNQWQQQQQQFQSNHNNDNTNNENVNMNSSSYSSF